MSALLNTINDGYHHLVGDNLLINIWSRMKCQKDIEENVKVLTSKLDQLKDLGT